MENGRSAHETLWALIKDIKFGMFTHRNAHGVMHAHPLTTQNKSLDEAAEEDPARERRDGSGPAVMLRVERAFACQTDLLDRDACRHAHHGKREEHGERSAEQIPHHVG